MALILLCALVSWTAWCLLLDSLALVGAGSCQNQPCGCMNTLPVDNSPAILCLYCLDISPFFLDLALTGAWTQNPQPFSPFPHAKPAGALGQCASPSWTCRPHRVTRGTSDLLRQPEAPQTCQAVSSTSGAHRGWQGLSVCPQEVVKMGTPSTAAALHQGASPQLGVGTTQHQTSTGVPHNFPSSSSWRVQDPEHLQEQPKCSPVPAHSLPRGQRPALQVDRIFTLSVFSFPNGVAGPRCPATSRF